MIVNALHDVEMCATPTITGPTSPPSTVKISMLLQARPLSMFLRSVSHVTRYKTSFYIEMFHTYSMFERKLFAFYAPKYIAQSLVFVLGQGAGNAA